MFKIENYLDKLTVIKESSSVYVCRCPVCDSDNLKISKTNGGWKCWRCENTKKIRDYLNPPQQKLIYDSSFDPSNVFIPRKYIKLAAFPVPKPEKISYYKTTSCDLSFRHSDFDVYYYSDIQKVQRSRDADGEKCIFFASREDKDSAWKWEKGNNNWCPYNLNKLEKMLGADLNRNCNAVVFVEGEKVANELTNHGIVALTIPGHSWNEYWIRYNIKLFQDYVKHITFIADHDKIGYKKAELFQNSCYFGGMSCEILKLTDFDGFYLDEHYDFCDLEKEEKIQVVEYLTNGRQ